MKEIVINLLIQNLPTLITFVFSVGITFLGTKKIIISNFLKKSGSLCTDLASLIDENNQEHVKQVLIDANDLKSAVQTLKEPTK